jgi:hypothetical protein
VVCVSATMGSEGWFRSATQSRSIDRTRRSGSTHSLCDGISPLGFGASVSVSAGEIWSSRDAPKVNPTGVTAEVELPWHFIRQPAVIGGWVVIVRGPEIVASLVETFG